MAGDGTTKAIVSPNHQGEFQLYGEDSAIMMVQSESLSAIPIALE